MRNNRICYVINFYFGNRRKVIDLFNENKLCFLQSQIETLNNYRHNISKIIFNFNVDLETLGILNDALKIIPKKIQNSDVEINIRENLGFSYAAFSENFLKNRNDFDYFVFNEDDYFLVQDNWDEYLVDKYSSLKSCGYLCPIVREPHKWNNYKRFAGHCFGISSTENLNKIVDRYGKLLNVLNNDYIDQEKVQIDFTNVFEEFGLKLYDIREEYRVAFAMTEKNDSDIHRHFWWNDKDLIVPAIFYYNLPHSWWECWDEEFTRKKIEYNDQ